MDVIIDSVRMGGGGVGMEIRNRNPG